MFKNKVRNILGLLGLIVLIFGFALATNRDNTNTDTKQFKDQLNFSGVRELSPIVIDGNGEEGLTWTEVASELGCSGSGSPELPYIIENIAINGNGVGDCILIQNSDAYFVIRNSIFYNSGNTNNPAVEAGIKLNNVDNGQLVNNTCYDNGNGIKLTDCINIIITENRVYDNAWWGIDFGWFHASGNYSIISRNIVQNNFAGISGASSGYECTGNLISENKVDSNNHYGIILGEECYGNNVTENNVTNNGFGGIGASGITLGGHDNLVCLNYVSGNYRNSKDLGFNNQWDNGSIGNYWDDYDGVDFDDNGIGDTPYLIYGSASSQDNFPIYDDGDDPPYDHTVDTSGVSTNIKIDGFPYIGIGGIKSYNFEEGTYPVYSYPGGLIATFNVDINGIISYDPIYEGVTLVGAGTRDLSILGAPIIVDTRGVSTNITVFGLPVWLKFRGTETVNLPVNSEVSYKFIAGLGGIGVGVLDNTSFTVMHDGNVSYDPILNEKTLRGLLTPTIEVIGYPISIDTTQLSTNITLYGLKYWFEYQSVKTLNLPPDCVYPYIPHAGLGGQPVGRLLNASFKVTKEGKVSYDPFFDGKTLTGRGTSNLKVLGYPINIDTRKLSTNITLYGLKYWFKFQNIEQLILPPVPEYPYSLHAGLGGMPIGRLLNATFTVNMKGNVSYDPFFDGKTLNGLGTSTLEIIGYSITIDVSDVTSKVALFGMKYYIEFGGMETFVLPPDIEYPYRISTDLAGILDETFIVKKDGTVNPTEIVFEYGIIRLYNDIIPPITTIDFRGTTGNNGWYISDVNITLTATDVSGVERIEYCIDTINWIEYTDTFPITLEGITAFQYRSIDTVGNVEPINTIEVKIDKTPPSTELRMSSYYVDLLGDIYVTPSTEFTLNAFDYTSGIESTYYRINGGIWYEYSENFTLIGSDGPYTIEFYSIDNSSNVEVFNAITVNLVNFEINSYLSKGEGNSITYFDVIFTKSKQTGEYRLVATNPGQIFYIIEFLNRWPTSIETLDIKMILPDDFQLKSIDSIIIYLDGVDITTDCYINGNLVTIQNIPSDSDIKVVVPLEYGLKGTTYLSLEDFGMKAYVFNSIVSGINGDPLVIDDGLEQSTQSSATLITHQKKTTAIAGYVYDIYGNAVEGALVELYLNGVPIKSIITDENGFFYFIDIDEGIYNVKVTFGSMSEIQVATASKNELTELEFVIDYENP